MTIELDHATFRDTLADVHAAVDTIRSTTAGIDRDVTALVAGGWTGIAARSFAEAWTDWRRAADEVGSGLLALGQLLEAVHLDLATRDQDAAAAVDTVARRIVTRLGP